MFPKNEIDSKVQLGADRVVLERRDLDAQAA